MRLPRRIPYKLPHDPHLAMLLETDEGAGTNVLDSSIHQNNGAIVGTGAWQAGSMGYTPYFDASGDYINCGYDASIVRDVSKECTIMAWINPAAVNITQTIFGRDDPGTTRHINCGIRDTGKLYAYAFQTNAIYANIDPGVKTLSANTWYHTAMVFDGSRLKLYVNSVLESTSVGTITHIQTGGTESFLIGAYLTAAPVAFFKGVMKYVGIYARALSASELLDIYERTKPQS